MGRKVAGTCYIKADGQQLVITGGVEAPLNKEKRETLRPGYFKAEDVIPFIKVDALKTPGVDYQAIAKKENLAVTAEFADGSVYALSGAYVVGDMNVAGDDAKISLQFEGSSGEWQ